MKITRNRIALVGVGLFFSLGAKCPGNCPTNQSLETVSYDPLGSPRAVTLQPFTHYCEVIREGVTEWVPVDSIGSRYTFNSTYLGEGTPNENGRKNYEVKLQQLWHRTSSSRFEAWLQCGTAEGPQSDVLDRPMIQYLDADAAVNQNNSNTVSIPVISWSQNGHQTIGEELNYHETRGTHHLPFSNKYYALCVYGGHYGATMMIQEYAPHLECADDNTAAPTQPAPVLACSTPMPTQGAVTCSGKPADASARVFEVPVSDPDSGCGNVVPEFANSAEEAKGCVPAGWKASDEVCEYAIHIGSSPDHWVTKRASDEASAEECATNTECSGDFADCPNDMIMKGDCTSL